MHPSEEIRGTKTKLLAGKQIILGVTGSIAAVQTIQLSREFIRHGADVIPVMSPAATRIIHPDALYFATGHQPICELSGDTEHVRYCGKTKSPADLYLLCPCTANTLSKIAYGIDDTAVTTFATTALGSNIPLVIVPAMHQSMYDHVIVKQNIDLLRKKGLLFIDPNLESNKAKLASIEMITHETIRLLGNHIYDGTHVLIIGGSSCEPIDTVRCICNTSSGKTALALATTAYHQGAEVELWYGSSQQQVPTFIKDVKRFSSVKDVEEMIQDRDLSTVDLIIVCAALSDYLPEKTNEKIPSEKKELNIICHPAPNILSLIRKKAPQVPLVGFKLESNEKTLIKKAEDLRARHHLTLVVANTTSNLSTEDGSVHLIGEKGQIKKINGTKNDIAMEILCFLHETIHHD